MTPRAVLLLAVVAGAAAADERPADYRYQSSLAVDGSSPHYRFSLPALAYRGTARRDLGDVRVFNSAGEPVPYAFAPRSAQAPAPEVRAATLYPLFGDRSKGLEAAAMRIERSARGTVVNVRVPPDAPASSRALLGYLVDASEVKAPKQALVLGWSSRGSFSGQARVEGSDDLKQWSTVAWSAPIIDLRHNDARLERNRIELSGAKAKYLRVSFSGVPGDFTLKSTGIELRGDTPEAAREWLSLQGKEGKAPGELVFDTEGHFPADRLRLLLPQPNTVAEVELHSRRRSEEPWRLAARTIVYRLGGNGEKAAEARNTDIAIAANADRHWRLKVDQKGGGFGAGEVRLELGWMPDELVFAARGAGPFTLAFGQRDAKPGALPAASVIPRGADGEPMPAKLVGLGLITEGRKPAASPFADALQFLRDGEGKKWLLWSALVAGVMFLAWMAFRLLRELGNPQTK